MLSMHRVYTLFRGFSNSLGVQLPRLGCKVEAFKFALNSAEGALYTHICQAVSPLVARVARMSFDPAPVDGVPARADQRVQPLPQVHVFDRRLGRCAPASGLPAVNPFGDALAHIFAVKVKGDLAGLFKGRQGFNHCRDFHAVVGRAQLAAKKFFFCVAARQYRTPAAGAGVALASSVGINHDLAWCRFGYFFGGRIAHGLTIFTG
jgi:hypothetical protein